MYCLLDNARRFASVLEYFKANVTYFFKKTDFGS